MIVTFLLLVFFTSGIKGTELNYTFDDQADGWLRLYQVPTTWNDAKIRCETEGAVIASPVVNDLRDAIKRHILQKSSSVFMIYTGVHAEYSNGDFFSIEGSHISRMTVPLEQGPAINYESPESCVLWNIYAAKLRKLKCDIKLPYVCYKKRTDSSVLNGLGNGVPETNHDVQITRPNGIINSLSAKLPPPDGGTQTNQWQQPDHPPQIHQSQQSNQQPQINEPLQPNEQQHINQQQETTQSQQQLTPNHQSQPAYAKCSVDGTNLVIINSEQESNILKYFNDNLSFTFIFADTAYIKELTKTEWQVVIQKRTPTTGTIPTHQRSQTEFNVTAIPTFVAPRTIPDRTQEAQAVSQGPPPTSPRPSPIFQTFSPTSAQTSSGSRIVPSSYYGSLSNSIKQYVLIAFCATLMRLIIL